MVSPAAPAVPWRTVMRERHVAAPRATAWDALIDLLGPDPDDVSVEPPWRHVRRRSVAGVDRCETTVTVRDDGAECHLAWYAGVTAEVDDTRADAVLATLASEGERLLDDTVRGATA